jgi:hypothetical protein
MKSLPETPSHTQTMNQLANKRGFLVLTLNPKCEVRVEDYGLLQGKTTGTAEKIAIDYCKKILILN